ncbi:vWA domain-containing protein [Kordiimonas sp. SCSIO 12610]|uniref:vWA domain-containing protein n=1 Tax=Kordiimonas sp. SCSIO 12610 TaxID=2829597 RepID=UPI00210A3F53|nr:vWA domain-containing protein [Kordiimonas sp. SCSIO 12610]UTW55666.1 hypothetical protein KFF44_01885 [Kordiimonas sp. SCSIO 12610]
MRRRDRETDIFSLSFLDIVSCAFGAVVLLLIISRPEMAPEGAASESKDLLRELFRSEAENAALADLSEQEKLNLEGLKNRNRALADQLEDVKDLTRTEEFRSAELAKSRAAIEARKTELEKLAQVQETTPDPEPTEEVGGIPVDSDYVIFVIDTSGSMRDKWQFVKSVIDRVLTMHPKVKGFQIINDNGFYLKDRGKWIPDTPSQRQLALRQTNRWSPNSNSNPYQGIAEALNAYGNRSGKLAIYVFGDDFSSRRYDNTVAAIAQLNSSGSGQKKARIHGIGFAGNSRNYRGLDSGAYTFSVLMSAVARENNGAYLSLSR